MQLTVTLVSFAYLHGALGQVLRAAQGRSSELRRPGMECADETSALGMWKEEGQGKGHTFTLSKSRGQPELPETCLKQNRRDVQISQFLSGLQLLCLQLHQPWF